MTWKTNKKTGGKFKVPIRRRTKIFRTYSSLRHHKSYGKFDPYD